jgi:hypothetical protein
MTVIYAAGIPVFFYVLAKAYHVDDIAQELTCDEYIRALHVAYSQDARMLHSVLTKSVWSTESGNVDMKKLSTMSASLLYGLSNVDSETTDDKKPAEADEDIANRLCPACEKLSKAWKLADLPPVKGTAHLRILSDKLGLTKGPHDHVTVEGVVAALLGLITDSNLLLSVDCVDDLKDEHLRALVRQNWNTILPPRKDTCYKCTHAVQVRAWILCDSCVCVAVRMSV